MVNEKMYVTILTVIAIIALVVSIATNEWSVLTTGSVKHTQGLWKYCTSVGNKCNKLPPINSPDYPAGALKAVRVCMLLSCLILVISIADMHLDPKDHHLQVMLLGVGSAFAMIGIIIYLAKLNKIGGTDASPGFSFYFALSSMVMAGIAAYSHYKSKSVGSYALL